MTERDDATGLPGLLTTTGWVAPVRSRWPIYLDILPPCNAGYPAGENTQEWLCLIEAGQHETTRRQPTADNLFPAIHDRVCYHPCETICNRKDLDAAVSTHSVKRYLGDLTLERGWRFETPSRDSRRRVLIIGTGPSELSAVHHLYRPGHEVEIRDSVDAPDGMMRYEIPEYWLPRNILDVEVARITDIGVMIHNDMPVTDLPVTQMAGRFDAVFVTIDTHLSKRVNIPLADAIKMVDAANSLRDVAEGKRSAIGRRVTVYSGGNTAMNAARATRRLGAKESVIVYRRTVRQTPVYIEGRESAEQGGVRMNWLRTITEVGEEDLVVETVELDKEGRVHGTGRFEKLVADTVILATRQEADISPLHAIPGMISDQNMVRVNSDTLMTNVPGIFAGGGTVLNERIVIIGIGHGKKATCYTDKWLSLDVAPCDPKHPFVHLDQMNLWYFGGHTRWVQAEQAPETRVFDFGEIAAGLSSKGAEFKARRCLSYGNCFECGGCYSICPEDAVTKLGFGSRYRLDYERCTGCIACYEQYPVHATEMIPEGRR